MEVSNLQEPDDLGTSLASSKGDDMTANAVIKKSTLVLVGLIIGEIMTVSARGPRHTIGRTLAIS